MFGEFVLPGCEIIRIDPRRALQEVCEVHVPRDSPNDMDHPSPKLLTPKYRVQKKL
jgi:hypothetical protein